jgi:NADPH:quinone reductase-like Zn-dependent oxidoreductase
VQLKGFGLRNLKLEDNPLPTPCKNEVLIKVGAVWLNFRDKAIVEGIYEPKMVSNPFTPVSDAAGTIVQIGAGITRFKMVDRVTSHLYPKWVKGAPVHNEPDFCFGFPLPSGLQSI